MSAARLPMCCWWIPTAAGRGGPRPHPRRGPIGRCAARASTRCATTPASRTPTIAQVLHGTTVGTNAILEGKGAVVGLVTTQGFRQVLQIARSFVPGGLAGWIIWPKPEPLAALENTIEVPERIGQRRHRWSPRWTRRRPGRGCARCGATAIQALAISLINAFANGEHEERIAADRRRGTARHPDLPIQRGAAGDARVRAGADHRGQQLRAAAGRPLRRQPVRASWPTRACRPSCPSCAATAAWPPPTSPPIRRSPC